MASLDQVAPYVVGFAAGVLATLFASYITWIAEMRRRGLEALLDCYDSIVAAVDDIGRFIGRWGGLARIDLGYNPQHPNREEVKDFWETRSKLIQLRMKITKLSPFLGESQEASLLQTWDRIWNWLHESGIDSKRDFDLHREMAEETKGLAQLIRQTFLTARGFVNSFHWK